MKRLLPAALLFALLLALLLGWAEAASADPFVAFTTDTTQSSTLTTNHVTVGYSFTPTESFTVLELGFFDSGQDGLVDPHQVGLWTGSGTLLASAAVPEGTSAALMGAYRFVPISPLALAQGETYVLGAEVGPIGTNLTDDPVEYTANAINPSFDPRVGPVAPRGTFANEGFAFPSVSASLTSMVPNFLAVPEPESAALFGAGLLALGAMRRSGRRPTRT